MVVATTPGTGWYNLLAQGDDAEKERAIAFPVSNLICMYVERVFFAKFVLRNNYINFHLKHITTSSEIVMNTTMALESQAFDYVLSSL